ncbi:DUF192 domain-containing protein [candidate division WWE3 bacterium]|nr:DUF192 domain-containing protein [candidate division WWE3 bacterium]
MYIKAIVFTIFVIALIVGSILFVNPFTDVKSAKIQHETIVTITNPQTNRPHTFIVEVANTPIKREEGLMNKERLDSNKGMLFTYDQPQLMTFWMKNTLIPLDLIVINNNKVVDIIESMEPCTDQTSCTIYKSKVSGDKAMEINGGLVEKLNIAIGDTISIENNP